MLNLKTINYLIINLRGFLLKVIDIQKINYKFFKINYVIIKLFKYNNLSVKKSFLKGVSKKRKGIILAGGSGSRLFPITLGVSKQLTPVFDKPMLYYPLSTIMLAGIRDILIIVKPTDLDSFKRLLGNGNHLGINISYEIQNSPDGLAQAFLIGKSFISNSPVALILGDNLYHGNDLFDYLNEIDDDDKGATVFACQVKDPERYGVPEFDIHGKVLSIEEKPLEPKSKYAITGLYFYDNTVIQKSLKIKPSSRGELEITDLNKLYLDDGQLSVKLMSRGTAWFDTGNFDSLHDASSYVRTIQDRQGLKIGCPEEIAWRMGWINDDQLLNLGNLLKKNLYGQYLLDLLKEI